MEIVPKQRAELQLWYVHGLRPKLAQAAADGTVSSAAADDLDRKLCDFLDVARSAPHEQQEAA
jgi:hypothetical protein